MPFARNQGTKIYYQVIGQGPPLLILHGGFGSQEDYFENGHVDALKEKYQLILLDLRGHGQSDKPHNSKHFSFRIMIEDIVAVLDKAGIDRCHVYGHSMGGWFIYGLAIYYPERLNSIVISDGVPGSGDSELFRTIAENLEEFVTKWESLSPAAKERVLNNDRQSLIAIADWLADELPSIIKEIDSVIERINVPTLIFMSNLEEGSEEVQLLRKSEAVIPDAKLLHFEDLDHIGISKNCDRIVPHIRDFLG